MLALEFEPHVNIGNEMNGRLQWQQGAIKEHSASTVADDAVKIVPLWETLAQWGDVIEQFELDLLVQPHRLLLPGPMSRSYRV